MGILATSEPFIPASGRVTLERVRKVRNKNAYRFHYVLEDGTRQSMVMKL